MKLRFTNKFLTSDTGSELWSLLGTFLSFFLFFNPQEKESSTIKVLEPI